MYLILYFQSLLFQDKGHESDIKRKLKMNVVCEKSKKTSKSISAHPGLRYYINDNSVRSKNACLFN